jgi:hypothetical protein
VPTPSAVASASGCDTSLQDALQSTRDACTIFCSGEQAPPRLEELFEILPDLSATEACFVMTMLIAGHGDKTNQQALRFLERQLDGSPELQAFIDYLSPSADDDEA